MNFEGNMLRFFLGANTPQGFVSRFEQLADPDQGWREYVIKGGPGSGKSTMMKRIAASLEESCPQMEVIHCSSDVDSVDAVIAPELRFSIADGTPPHAGCTVLNKSQTSLASGSIPSGRQPIKFCKNKPSMIF